MITENCNCENPELPDYAPTPPASDPNCVECGCNSGFYTPPEGSGGSGGKPVEILAGTDIMVENLSDVNTYRFRVNYQPYTALVATLAAPVPYIAGVNALVNGFVLFGRTVDRVDLSWSYNKVVTSQSITTSIPAYTPPALTAGETSKSLTGLSVGVDRSFTINGNDGAGQSGSVDTDTKSVLFGNFARWGKGADRINTNTAATLQAMFNALPNSINTNTRNRSIFASGGVNEHDFYFYPARFGEATFQKGIFVGGFVRLKNVNGTLYQTIPDGETEDPITISNGFGSENYYVYQTLYDNQTDSVTPIVIT